ncbi:hypothetical protein [Desulfovibrio sp.]|nr:hypothetical protein [Desulfovibrio sp.]
MREIVRVWRLKVKDCCLSGILPGSFGEQGKRLARPEGCGESPAGPPVFA